MTDHTASSSLIWSPLRSMKIKFYLITLHTARSVFVHMLCALFAEKCMTFYVSSEIAVMENTHSFCSDWSLTFSVPLDQTLIFSKTHSLDNQIHESLSMVTLWVACLDTVSKDCFIHGSAWTIQVRGSSFSTEESIYIVFSSAFPSLAHRLGWTAGTILGLGCVSSH